MKSIAYLAGAALAVLMFAALSAAPAHAQASGSNAELRGQVVDQTGAVVPGARVALTDIGKGTSRTATTDGEGNYTFLNLLPSAYELRVEAQGFQSSSTRVELTVGQQATIPVRLGAAELQAEVQIVAGAEVVEVARSEQSSVIDARQIVNLPISRRNYLDYALLTPGVNDSDNIADASDYRVAQTPQTGLSFGGNNGRDNLVAIDGGVTLSASGGVIATVSQEAVQEFQVVRNSYSAEFGGGSGGTVNIVSKSGGNDYHGSIFGLFRDRSLDARNAFDFNPSGQSPFNRQQFGGSLGGAIKRDKSFFFAAFERFSQEETTFVNLLNDPNIFQITDSQRNLFDYLNTTPFAALSGALRSALTTTNYPGTIDLFTRSSGQFPFDSHQNQFSVRLDHNFSDRSSGYLRFNISEYEFENQAAGALTAVSRGRTLDSWVGGVLASHNLQLGSTMFNEVKAQYIYNRFGVIPNDPNGPEFNIEGFGNFGRDIFLPAQTIERHYDFYDNFSKVAGSHTLKAGVSLNINNISTNSETFFGGRFNFGTAIPLANLIALNPAAGPAVLTQLQQFLQANNPAQLAALAAPINALQSFNLGLPIVYQQGFGDAAADSWSARYGMYIQDTWKMRPNVTLNYGLRYQINDEPFFMPTRYNNVQPRLGLSWDPKGDGKTVIRAGYGIFFGAVNNAVANVTRELAGFDDPTTIFIVLATPTTNNFGLPRSFDVYQGLAAATGNFSRPIRLSDLSGILAPAAVVPAGVPRRPITPGPGQPLEVRFRLEPNYQNPTTYQSSFGLQRDLGGGFSLDAGYLFVRGLHLTRNRDVNQFKRSGPLNALNPNGGATFVRFPAAGQTTDFRNPFILQDNVYESSANSFYHAMTLAVTRRFANNFSINTHYTLSKTIDEVTDFNSDFSAQNPLDVRADRALSAFDQRHRLVVSGVFQSGFGNMALRDWVFSPIFIAGSGRPFNLLLGFDGNGDGRPQSDRPGAAGRNTGRGEAFYSFDMRLARRFFAQESRYLELTFEAFNLFNRVNMAGINNIVGPTLAAETNFDVRGRRDRRPTDPLGFISAANARQIQLGVRFNF
ncbi:MAG: TonB-dependent receptor [Blastocatellales bacterium]|nr:TonB-dependent receptor [Blastocatellales bacterium]